MQSHRTCSPAWLVVVSRGASSTSWLCVVVKKEGTGEDYLFSYRLIQKQSSKLSPFSEAPQEA